MQRLPSRGLAGASFYHIAQDGILRNYQESIHGEGLFRKGLHRQLPHTDVRSSIARASVARTCTQCHVRIENVHRKVIRGELWEKDPGAIPACVDCHQPHKARRVFYTLGMADEDCMSYHGKVLKLGYGKTAKCYDCHGAHDILPVWNPASQLSRESIIKTCAECHPGSNRRFAGYLTHATHHEPHKYPVLFWTFWGMTGLLVGTFLVAGLHTLAWLPRLLHYRRELERSHALESAQYVQRIPKLYRNLHVMVIVSFIGLAVTGMSLKFSYTEWAKVLWRLLGGFETAGYVHWICAVITFAYFVIHIYFAVFWGVAMIGSTGLLLWFPEFFTRILPGSLINVATVIHSDEALLAVGFIFTIHFFNTHFRPEKFPMDTVIFTGTIPFDEFKVDRPREYAELVASGELESKRKPRPTPRRCASGRS